MPHVAPGQFLVYSLVLLTALASGCGKTLNRTATEQLVLSDAVDRSIATIDFQPLEGQKVYLDTTYIKPINNNMFVNADYIISSLRQQMVASRCLLQEKREDADYIVEARVGTLGADSHELTYGVPANNLLSTAAQIVPTAPPIPTMPEISVAKRSDQMAAAKIAVFAYERETREPVWQSGVSVAKSTAKDSWLIGAGPFQSGSIYKGTRFAGQKFRLPFFGPKPEEPPPPRIAYDQELLFLQPPAPAYAKQPAPTDTQPVSTEGAPAPAAAQPKSAAAQPPPAAKQPQPATPNSVSTGPAPADIVVQPRGSDAQTYNAASFMPPIQRADATREATDAPQPR